MNDFKQVLGQWYIDSIKFVTNKDNIKNPRLGNGKTVFKYLKESKYEFLNDLLECIHKYNKGNKDDVRTQLLQKLTWCARNKFIYNNVIEVIYEHRKKSKAIHCNWKEVYHVIKDKELDKLLTYLGECNYRQCMICLYGTIKYKEEKELKEEIELEIVNRLGELIGKKPLTKDELLNCKNKINNDKVNINVYKCKKLKELGITNINLFVNEYVDNYIKQNGGNYQW